MKGLDALEDIKKVKLIDHVQVKEGLFSNKLLSYERRYGRDVFSKQIPIIEKELKEGEANKNALKNALKILRIIFNAPYILETLMKRNELGKSASDRYLWGSITDEEVKKIKEFFSNGKI